MSAPRLSPDTVHTATPWTRSCFQVYGADKSKIAHTGMGQLPPYRSTESEANAAFIVEAVNNHDRLVKELADANAEIELLRGGVAQTSGWQPIETAPKDGPAFLIWVPDNLCIYEVIVRDGNFSIFGGGFRDNLHRATLWRPLPAAPDTTVVPSTLPVPLARRSEADAYFKILQTIARFPITDPCNMDAVNMRLIAEGACAVSKDRSDK